MTVCALIGVGDPAILAFVLDPSQVVTGELWRLVTWPLAYPEGVTLNGVITVAVLWYFGRDLERELLGRAGLLRYLLAIAAVLTVVLIGVYYLLGGINPVFEYGLDTIELMVFLTWVAEWPNRPFLFNIPAWVVGLVIVFVQVMGSVGSRGWDYLVYFLVSVACCAILARSMGMLSEIHGVPKLALPRRQPKAQRTRRHPSVRGQLIAGPWAESSPQARAESPDEARMNALLEKIHAQGADALSEAERAELLALRDRLRKR